MAVLGSVVVPAAEALRRIGSLGAVLYVRDGADLWYTYASGQRYVQWRPMADGKVLLISRTDCGCQR
jgi:hypothetical protein